MDFLQKLAEMEEWNGGQGPVERTAPPPKVMKQKPSKNKTLMHMLYRTQAEEEEVTSQHDGLIKFFQDNPSPSEEEMNAFAEEMGTDPDALDERIYALLSSLLKGVGKNNDRSDDEFDAEQLAKGIEVEMEHTEDELIAKMIAKDHLSEVPDYYDRLGQMEDEAGDEANADADMEMDMDPDELGDEDMDMDDREYDDAGSDFDEERAEHDEDMEDEMDPNYEDDPESEFKSGDLEDDEFEVNLGHADDMKDRPRKKKKRITFKESLIRG